MAILMRLAELEKGDVLGEMVLFDDRSRTNSSAFLHHVCADLEVRFGSKSDINRTRNLCLLSGVKRT